MANSSYPRALFGRRLRAARERLGLPQDKLGVMIGLDESCSSARISRYESGVHEPSFITAKQLADVLKVPTAYLYCEEDQLAEIILRFSALTEDQRTMLVESLQTI